MMMIIPMIHLAIAVGLWERTRVRALCDCVTVMMSRRKNRTVNCKCGRKLSCKS